ncbi:MAG: 2-phosphosulfolactate phosphatase [Desulfitobacterium hafniense]|nr:2-phosphosulfolactate phosphatase [Desulfitobacterium hafniense]
MLIEVLPSANLSVLPYLQNKIVIVIDVLRATSTMVTALANGCQAIIPVLTPEEAIEKRLMIPGALLGGERKAIKIEGFDLGNSPFDYVPEKVGGKRIIMTTTNGTRAIRAAAEAPHVWMASFLNLQSIILSLYRHLESNRNLEGILIICAGTEDRFDLPDTLCAGMLIDQLRLDLEVNDLAKAAMMLYSLAKDDLVNVIRSSDHARRLMELEFDRDIIYCCTQNILPIVPVLKEGEIVWLT